MPSAATANAPHTIRTTPSASGARPTGLTSWWFGLALGGVQAAFIGGSLANLLLPAVHPRMGTPWTDAEETPLLEPPGFMLANYGPNTAVVTLALHLAYGAIVGAFAAGL